MQKSLVKDVAFGGASARITVTLYNPMVDLDGDRYESTRVEETVVIEIVTQDGDVVAEDSVSTIIEQNPYWADFIVKAKLDPSKKYTKIGKAIAEGSGTHDNVKAAIKELKEELAAEFGVKTKEQRKREEVVNDAQEVVALAEKQGINNLLSREQLKKWKKNYNDLHNEGGEGYIPVRVSIEEYEHALAVLQQKE